MNFFSTAYLFEKNPPTLGFLPFIAGIFLLLIISAFILWSIYQRKDKKMPIYKRMKQSLFNSLFYPGIAGLVLCFFSWQQITYLGSRIWLLVLLLGFLAGFGLFGYYRFFVFPREKEKYFQKINYQKYLPH